MQAEVEVSRCEIRQRATACLRQFGFLFQKVAVAAFDGFAVWGEPGIVADDFESFFHWENVLFSPAKLTTFIETTKDKIKINFAICIQNSIFASGISIFK
jgi:homoserine trans-succinylase